MSANLYDDDPVRDAEMAAARWADSYIGRRRMVEHEVMEHLVNAHIAFLDGQRDLHDTLLSRALDGLYAQGHTTATAMAAIHREMARVKAQARDIRAGLDALATVANVDDLMRRAQHG